MRNSSKILIAFALLLSLSLNAAALEQKSMSRYSSECAEASWSEVVGNRTINTQISVTEENDQTGVYFSTSTWGPNYYFYKSGSTYTRDDVFKMSKNLDSASLSEIEVEAYYYSYDEMGGYASGTETLRIKADWTGVGELNERSSKYSVEDGDYTSKVSESYLSRGAKATGSINGINLGDSSYAWLSSLTSTSTSMKK
ncbi:hypothetical protein [Methanosarcina sp.]|uniref:hypothetical protein n=1 Tax=Methanosarcina sp. TaxID=2213 RepID=UPI002ABAB90A|nr:hypothetical protein [Methanosarcina sp.]MDY9926299.1 hypothetical protein [Methanosarcina sp.]